MFREYRVHKIRRGAVDAEPLDGAGMTTLRIAAPSRYIENEVIVVEHPEGGVPGDPGSAEPLEVHASRINPAILGGKAARLADRGDGSHELEMLPGAGDLDAGDPEAAERALDRLRDDFEDILDELRCGSAPRARRRLVDFIEAHPLHIDAYHHLAVIEWDRGAATRSLKYDEMGYRLGLAALPPGFEGRLPWACLGNRPFLRSAHGYALSLDRQRRHLEACEVFERLLRFNPNDNQGVRFLLPRSYLKAGAPAKALEVLERVGADGTSLFTRALLEVHRGRPREAVRWLWHGTSYNVYVPRLLAGAIAGPSVEEVKARWRWEMGGIEEAVVYAHEMRRFWKRLGGLRFLARVLEAPGFRTRLQEAEALALSLAEESDRERRRTILDERKLLFGEEEVRELLKECEALY